MMWLCSLIDGTIVFDKYLAVFLVLFASLAFVVLLVLVKGRRVIIRSGGWLPAGCALLVLVGTTGVLLRSGCDTNDQYGLPRSGALRIARLINASQPAPHTVIFVSNDFGSNYWLGLLKGKFTTQWYSPYDKRGPAAAVPETTGPRTIWLVIDRAHMPSDADPYLARRELGKQAYEISETWVGDFQLYQYLSRASMLEAANTGLSVNAGVSINDHYALMRADARQLAQIINSTKQTPYALVLVSESFNPDY
jgi:hypothetical protein